MWFCCNDGFVSVVADRHHATRLLIRARRRRDLVNILGNDVGVFEDPNADYRWRCFVEREAFTQIVAKRIEAIDYPNFKNSVPDQDLHDMYNTFWGVHLRYQVEDPSRPPVHRRKEFSWEPEDLEKQ